MASKAIKELLKRLHIHPDAVEPVQSRASYTYRTVAPGSQPKATTPDREKGHEYDITFYSRDGRRMLDANYQDVKLFDTSLKAKKIYASMPEHLPAPYWMRHPEIVENHHNFLMQNNLPPTIGICVERPRTHEINSYASQENFIRKLNEENKK
eukprot:c1444_g1_i1.p1 GENE.c1444_g1_i1~~c1444_g1_i1.p1  ORF type:complete len:161 (-),score=57.41 c1444_g1_i1:131-589(-)